MGKFVINKQHDTPSNIGLPPEQRVSTSNYAHTANVTGKRGNAFFINAIEQEKETSSMFGKFTHSDEHTVWEILAGQIVRLLGNNIAPKSKFGEQDDQHEKLMVMSSRMVGYKDLSKFLCWLGDNEFYMKQCVPIQQHERFSELYKSLVIIEGNTKQIEKNKIMQEMTTLLRDELQQQLNELYAVSAFIGNWDMFNYDLLNMGFRVVHDKNGNLAITPAMVDLGNCLAIGFGGKYKIDSHKIANTPPEHHHPPTEEQDKIPENAASFDSTVRYLLQDIPRRKSFDTIFQTLSKSLLSYKTPIEGITGDCKLPKGFLEGIIRITEMDERTLESTINQWFHLGTKITFSIDSDHKIDKEYILHTIRERRQCLQKEFKKPIQEFKTQYPDEYQNIKRQVAEAAHTTKDIQTQTDNTQSSGIVNCSNSCFSWIRNMQQRAVESRNKTPTIN